MKQSSKNKMPTRSKVTLGIAILLMAAGLGILGYRGVRILRVRLEQRENRNVYQDMMDNDPRDEYADLIEHTAPSIPGLADPGGDDSHGNNPKQEADNPGPDAPIGPEGDDETTRVVDPDRIELTTPAPSPDKWALNDNGEFLSWADVGRHVVDRFNTKYNTDAYIAYIDMGPLIREPIVHASWLNDYLWHDVHGKENKQGEVTLSHHNDGLDDPLLYIFGHHLIGGGKFTDLAEKSAENFRHVTFYTRDKVYDARLLRAGTIATGNLGYILNMRYDNLLFNDTYWKSFYVPDTYDMDTYKIERPILVVNTCTARSRIARVAYVYELIEREGNALLD